MTKLTPSRALAELQAQHAALRTTMDRCETLADAVETGRGALDELTREVVRLRLAFDAHNTYEEQLLRPILLAEDAFAAVRIDRMVEDHAGEHRAMRARLTTGETGPLRETLDLLRAHLEAEERYLLGVRILRDDVVTVESGG